MTKTLLALLFVAALPGMAEAKTFKLGEGKPVAEITIPDGWESTTSDGGIEATAPDVYLSGEIFDVQDAAETSSVASEFLADQKIKLNQATKTQKGTKVAGLIAVETAWDATDPDGPTRVRIDVIKVREGKLLLVIYWRSEEGEKAHGAEVDAIMGSIKPLK